MTTLQLIAHLVSVVVLVAAYTALTIAGHDGTALLGALGGYLGGAGVNAVATAAKPGG